LLRRGRLFDPNQPTLWTCCMISNKNVDADGFCRLISRLNLSFHLVELDKSFHATADREVVRLPVDDEGREPWWGRRNMTRR